MQPQINDMERRLGIMQSVEPVLENAIKTLQKVVDVRGMGKKLLQIEDQEISLVMDDDATCWSGKTSYLRPNDVSKEDFEKEGNKYKCKDPCAHEKYEKEEAKEKADAADIRERQLEITEAKKAAKKITDKQEEAEEKAFKGALENDEALKKEVEGKPSGKVGTKAPA